MLEMTLRHKNASHRTLLFLRQKLIDVRYVFQGLRFTKIMDLGLLANARYSK